jgi:hypothetical protein
MTDIDYKTDIERIREAKKAYQDLIKSIGTKGLKQLCQDTLDTTGLEAIRWRQYTPYFNDGDSCEFGIREPEFYIAGTRFHTENRYGSMRDAWADEYAFYKEASYDQSKHWTDPTRVTYFYAEPGDEIVHITAQFFDRSLQDLEEVLKEVFGDHVQVTYRDGEFTVEDYDHD